MARSNQVSDNAGTKLHTATLAVVDARGKLLDPNKCFNFKIKGIKLHGKKANAVDLSQGPELEDAEACIVAYQKQVTALTRDNRDLMQR